MPFGEQKMDKNVNLSVVLPSGTFLKGKAGCVIVPAVRADVAILPQRAPSIFTLDYGLLQIFDDEGRLTKRYFVKSGVVQTAQNACVVATRAAVAFDEVSPEDAARRLDTAENEDERVFYQMVLDYQHGVRRSYLQTLNLYNANRRKTQGEILVELRDGLESLKKRMPKDRMYKIDSDL